MSQDWNDQTSYAPNGSDLIGQTETLRTRNCKLNFTFRRQVRIETVTTIELYLTATIKT